MRHTIIRSTLRSFFLLLGLLAVSASASAYDAIYIFGDSLSDTGNAQILTNGQAPSRFSNGIVAVDVVAGSYGMQAIPFLAGGNNYAIGGARAVGSETEFDTNLPIQINTYLQQSGQTADADALYIVIIGGNDLFDAQKIRATSVPEDSGKARQDIRKAAEQRVTDAVLSVELQLTKLVLAGARHIVVGNAPDIALAPATDQLTGYLSASADDHQEAKRAGKFYKYSSRLAAQFNEELAAAIARVETAADLDIAEWDLADFLSNQIEDADVLGYTNTEDACTDSGALPDCDGFVFFDGVHPTTVVHQRAGQNILQLLAQ